MPINNQFVEDIKRAILDFNMRDEKIPSTKFKPSGMHCERSMYFTGLGVKPDKSEQKYNWIGAAQTGSMRHEGIQSVLEKMSKDSNYDWEYVDVADYVKMKQAEGKCKEVEIGDKQGAETHLYSKKLNLSFLCDGIVKQKSTGDYYLFEFKNKKSNKFASSAYSFPMEHYDQVVCYCTTLDLEKVFLVMENRDTLELCCPELFIVTQEMKDKMIEKIQRVLKAIEEKKVPRKTVDNKECFFCGFKQYCEKAL